MKGSIWYNKIFGLEWGTRLLKENGESLGGIYLEISGVWRKV